VDPDDNDVHRADAVNDQRQNLKRACIAVRLPRLRLMILTGFGLAVGVLACSWVPRNWIGNGGPGLPSPGWRVVRRGALAHRHAPEPRVVSQATPAMNDFSKWSEGADQRREPSSAVHMYSAIAGARHTVPVNNRLGRGFVRSAG